MPITFFTENLYLEMNCKVEEKIIFGHQVYDQYMLNMATVQVNTLNTCKFHVILHFHKKCVCVCGVCVCVCVWGVFRY